MIQVGAVLLNPDWTVLIEPEPFEDVPVWIVPTTLQGPARLVCHMAQLAADGSAVRGDRVPPGTRVEFIDSERMVSVQVVAQ